MKAKWCFLRATGQLMPDAFIYVVWVGSSLRESAKLALVEEYCKDCGLYFHRWSPQVDSALEQMEKGFWLSGTQVGHKHPMISITIHELFDMIIDDSFAEKERNFTLSPFGVWMRFRNTIDYVRYQNKLMGNTKCSPFKRKYLSYGKLTEGRRAALCCVGVLMIFLLDSLMSAIFSSLTI